MKMQLDPGTCLTHFPDRQCKFKQPKLVNKTLLVPHLTTRKASSTRILCTTVRLAIKHFCNYKLSAQMPFESNKIEYCQSLSIYDHMKERFMYVIKVD